MFNPYIIVLVLFSIAGIATLLWGWHIISKARKTRQWPKVQGKITESRMKTDAGDMMPHIVYSYVAGDQQYSHELQFQSSTSLTPEFANNYLAKFPEGMDIDVYYDPSSPDNATIEPGMAKGDWMIFVIGILATVFSIFALLLSG
ncbi:MAG: DUF3592 domain-containing protein [Gammaproteobacteria bacterium]